MLRSVTKVVDLPASPAVAFAYLAAVEKWPEWAVHSVKSASPTDAGVWQITTPRGPGKMSLELAQRWRILDIELTDGEGNLWRVPARVVAATTGAAFIRTYSQPTALPDGAFRQVMDRVDEESQLLRLRLAARRGA